jgi:hypothetical protein
LLGGGTYIASHEFQLSPDDKNMLINRLILKIIAAGFTRYLERLLIFTILMSVLALWWSAFYLLAGKFTAGSIAVMIK